MTPPNFPYRQSLIKTFRLCPEAARLDLLNLLPDMTSDATHMGTALHLVAEDVLRSIIQTNKYSETKATDIGRAYLQEQADAGVRLVIQNSWKAVLKRYELACRQWFWWFEDRTENGMLNPDTSQWVIEHSFEFQWGGLTCQGQVDFFDGWHAFDWKTGKLPESWEMQRWDVQSPMYVKALMETLELDEPPGFVFVYPSGRKVKREDGTMELPFPYELVMEDPALHHRRLQLEMRSIQLLAERVGLDAPWPLRINTWYCSEKWCGNWANCVGATFPHEEGET